VAARLGQAGIYGGKTSTAKMGAETMDSGVVFLDTSLIIAATVVVHPSHSAAAAYVDGLIAAGGEPRLSPQVCREFLVVLTRQPVSGRSFTLDEALGALSVWTTGCVILEESDAVLQQCLRLVRAFSVTGKQIHDCNIVATMKVHGVQRLATRNAVDFKRYLPDIEVDAIG
jgi:predicted nucleic acid-binding protein